MKIKDIFINKGRELYSTGAMIDETSNVKIWKQFVEEDKAVYKTDDTNLKVLFIYGKKNIDGQ